MIQPKLSHRPKHRTNSARRWRKPVKHQTSEIAYEPLSPLQRRHLWGLVVLCAIGSLMLALTVFLFIAMLLDPQAHVNRLAMWIFVLVPGGFLVTLAYFGVQYGMDAWAGVGQVRMLKLRERLPRRKGVTNLCFDKIGTLSFNHGMDGHLLPETTDGDWYRVTYSPHSRTLWSIRLV